MFSEKQREGPVGTGNILRSWRWSKGGQNTHFHTKAKVGTTETPPPAPRQTGNGQLFPSTSLSCLSGESEDSEAPSAAFLPHSSQYSSHPEPQSAPSPPSIHRSRAMP